MMKFKKLDDDNFVMYAIQHYDNPQCRGLDEFYEDISRVVYLRRLFKKYLVSGVLKERLILNHLITIYNIFGMEASTRILFMKLDKDQYSVLKTFLVYLQYIKVDHSYTEWGLDMISINLDEGVVRKLREI